MVNTNTINIGNLYTTHYRYNLKVGSEVGSMGKRERLGAKVNIFDYLLFDCITSTCSSLSVSILSLTDLVVRETTFLPIQTNLEANDCISTISPREHHNRNSECISSKSDTIKPQSYQP